ncbi:hypothetical protein CAEBREN_24920 [Caenorhabditis brenneri]|uniref:Sdz-33 F-box domain-containing protein n=1 Tax=Caenorhabditis brenneri TaxID=135651 RepID=G0NS93_CAEBE|nr:hypothetical protein CAEBREN_24920 [Caenorhabditis brenneri]
MRDRDQDTPFFICVIQKDHGPGIPISRDRLGFSLISKKCKKLTISSKIKGKFFAIGISNVISISLSAIHVPICLNFYTEPSLDWIVGTDVQKKTLKPPEFVSIHTFHRGPVMLKWPNTKEFGMREWLDHIQTVFDCREYTYTRIALCAYRFDIDFIKETFGNSDFLSIEHTGNYGYNESILEKLTPIGGLGIADSVFPDSKIPSKVLIQNFDRLAIGYKNDGLRCATLDELLMMNSASIEITTHQTPVKMLNKFVKLWQQGANPRMKHFRINYHNGSETDINGILNGIKCDEVRQKRLQYTLVNKGFYTYKMDGTKVKILFECSDIIEGMIQLRLLLV